MERFDCLGKLTLAIVVAGELHVHGRVVRSDLTRLDQRLLGQLVIAALLVDVGEREVVGGFLRIELDHPLHHRFGLRRVIHLVRTVRVDQILQSEPLDLRILLHFGGLLVIGDRLGQERIVGR